MTASRLQVTKSPMLGCPTMSRLQSFVPSRSMATRPKSFRVPSRRSFSAPGIQSKRKASDFPTIEKTNNELGCANSSSSEKQKMIGFERSSNMHATMLVTVILSRETWVNKASGLRASGGPINHEKQIG